MGVTTVITGMDPMIAMTLVEMGMDLEGVRTALNLEAGLDLLKDLEQEEDEEDEGAEAEPAGA